MKLLRSLARNKIPIYVWTIWLLEFLKSIHHIQKVVWNNCLNHNFPHQICCPQNFLFTYHRILKDCIFLPAAKAIKNQRNSWIVFFYRQRPLDPTGFPGDGADLVVCAPWVAEKWTDGKLETSGFFGAVCGVPRPWSWTFFLFQVIFERDIMIDFEGVCKINDYYLLQYF